MKGVLTTTYLIFLLRLGLPKFVYFHERKMYVGCIGITLKRIGISAVLATVRVLIPELEIGRSLKSNCVNEKLVLFMKQSIFG